MSKSNVDKMIKTMQSMLCSFTFGDIDIDTLVYNLDTQNKYLKKQSGIEEEKDRTLQIYCTMYEGEVCAAFDDKQRAEIDAEESGTELSEITLHYGKRIAP